MTEREQIAEAGIIKSLVRARGANENLGMVMVRKRIAREILNLADSEGHRLLAVTGEWKDKPDSEGWWWFYGYEQINCVEVYRTPFGELDIVQDNFRRIPELEGKWSKAIVPEIEKGE